MHHVVCKSSWLLAEELEFEDYEVDFHMPANSTIFKVNRVYW